MRTAILCLAIAGCALSMSFSVDPFWTAYKEQFNKVYESAAVESYRYGVFLSNMARAADFNSVEAHARYGWTKYSDQTVEELFRPLPVPSERTITMTNGRVADTPDSFDWREKGAVLPVKDQGQCGSCWAFCAVCALEGANMVKNSKLIGLSEQEIVDCDKNDHGCSGGWPTRAFEWVKSAGGIATEVEYPYHARDEDCKFSKVKPVVKVDKIYDFGKLKEDAMREKVQTLGPIAVAIDARKFNSYSRGIMDGSGCYGSSPNHGVTVVGWGAEGSTKYWIVRNSWGASWGESGYVRMQRGVDACGIETYPMGVSVL